MLGYARYKAEIRAFSRLIRAVVGNVYYLLRACGQLGFAVGQGKREVVCGNREVGTVVAVSRYGYIFLNLCKVGIGVDCKACVYRGGYSYHLYLRYCRSKRSGKHVAVFGIAYVYKSADLEIRAGKSKRIAVGIIIGCKSYFNGLAVIVVRRYNKRNISVRQQLLKAVQIGGGEDFRVLLVVHRFNRGYCGNSYVDFERSGNACAVYGYRNRSLAVRRQI